MTKVNSQVGAPTNILTGPQPVAVLDNYDCIIIVAGSRDYNVYDEFVDLLETRLLDEDLLGCSIIFVTGRARRGPDDMIITWCKENGFPWVEFPANWDEFGKAAGFIRNVEMAEVGSHLIAFHAGNSRGTKHMIDNALSRGLLVTRYLVNTDEEHQREYGKP